nr:MAG TPA: hypothetical protein [Caudoviricetes sp.]
MFRRIIYLHDFYVRGIQVFLYNQLLFLFVFQNFFRFCTIKPPYRTIY